MTNDELKEALLSEQPVESGGIVYQCVSAIIYRKTKAKDGVGIKVTAELLDRTGHSVSIAEPARITATTDNREEDKSC